MFTSILLNFFHFDGTWVEQFICQGRKPNQEKQGHCPSTLVMANVELNCRTNCIYPPGQKPKLQLVAFLMLCASIEEMLLPDKDYDCFLSFEADIHFATSSISYRDGRAPPNGVMQ